MADVGCPVAAKAARLRLAAEHSGCVLARRQLQAARTPPPQRFYPARLLLVIAETPAK